MTDIYYGIEPKGKKKVPATLRQAFEKNQLRRWGVEQIQKKKLEDLKEIKILTKKLASFKRQYDANEKNKDTDKKRKKRSELFEKINETANKIKKLKSNFKD